MRYIEFIKVKKIIIVFISLFFIFSCAEDEDINLEKNDFLFEFETSTEGWVYGFADYPVGEENFYELSFEHTSLPKPLDTSIKALKQSGNNHSDDLFMFIKRKFTNLKPNHKYQIEFDIEIATDAADNSVGVGGSPGSSVSIKAGASLIEPNKVVVENLYRMNIDKSNQNQSGKDMVVIGDFSNGLDEFIYNLKSLKSDTFSITTDEKGEFWLIIGTDSGFEATTTIYYNSISIKLK